MYSFVSQASIFLYLGMDSREGTEQTVGCWNNCHFGKKKKKRSQKKDFLTDKLGEKCGKVKVGGSK